MDRRHQAPPTDRDERAVITPGRVTGEHPLSHQQEGLLGVIGRLGGQHDYWLACAIRLHGDVDRRCLEEAVGLTVERHPALRTRLDRRPGGFVQRVDTPTAAPPQRIDLSALGGDRAVHDVAARFFDNAPAGVLAGSELWRIALVEHTTGLDLLTATHHLVFDLWSWGLFLADVAAAYRYLASNEPLPEPPSVTYSDYARWQRRHISGTAYDRHLAHWRQVAAGYPATGITLSRPPATGRPASGPADSVSFHLDAHLVGALHRLGQQHGTTAFLAMLAVLQATLAGFTDCDDVLAGVVTANRRRPEVTDVIGFFANGRYLRTTIRPAVAVHDLIAQVAGQWRDGHRHQELHLEKTVLDLGAPDLVNVKFALQDALTRVPAPDFGGAVDVEHLPTPPPTTARRHLNVSVTPTPSGLAGTTTYRTDVLSRADATRLMATYCDNLRSAVTGPDEPVAGVVRHARRQRGTAR